jgi:hypothetical protein
VLVVFLIPALARAHSAAALQQFETGKQAFVAQDYATALSAFEGAEAAGMSGPAVQFNIGVSAYKLGRWSRAKAAFLEAARTPEMAPLAHYNLGLAALGESDEGEAARWFALAGREATDERLKALIAERLGGLPRRRQSEWVAYGSFAAGYDDNVALTSGGDVLGVSDTEDTFAELQLAATAPPVGAWRFDGDVVLLDYQDLDSFDQLTINAGARYRVPLGQWNGEAGMQLTYSTIDGEGLDTRRILRLQATRALSDEWRLRVRYRFNHIDGLDGFDSLDGTRHDFGVRGAWRRERWAVYVQYRFDTTDYASETLSFDRHQFSVDAFYDLDSDWALQASLAHDRSSYEVAENGSENRSELALAVTRNLNTRWRAIVRYAHADNQADVPEFDYQRNRISAGVEATW